MNQGSHANLSMLAIFSAMALMIGLYGCEPEPEPEPSDPRPIVFVHGMAGSADQFETQALRFAGNGYPAEFISGFEYNTLIAIDVGRSKRLDSFIDDVLSETGADKVELVGHSMGTMVCQNYLRTKSHAAKVAHYVNLDGSVKDSPPGGVPTLAIFASHSVTEEHGDFGGAVNVTIPGTTHVQLVSHIETFREMFKFFKDEEPATTDILSGASDRIILAGKMISFLTNAVPDFEGGVLDIYEVDGAKGFRRGDTPVYSTQLSAHSGAFYFDGAKAGVNYEFCLSSELYSDQGHFYYEPFVRSDHLLRLKFAEPGGLMDAMLERNENHTLLVVIRNKEFIGDDEDPDLGVDSLKVNETELCSGLLPTSGMTIGLFLFDRRSDSENDLSSPLPLFSLAPFINALDFFMPSAAPPDGVISVAVRGRLSARDQIINVPNWSSANHAVFTQFLDY